MYAPRVPSIIVINITSNKQIDQHQQQQFSPMHIVSSTRIPSSILTHPLYPLEEEEEENEEENTRAHESIKTPPKTLRTSARSSLSIPPPTNTRSLPPTFVLESTKPLLKLRMSSLKGYEFVVPYPSLRINGRKPNEILFIQKEHFFFPVTLLMRLARLGKITKMKEKTRGEEKRMLVEVVTLGLQTLIDLPKSFKQLDQDLRSQKITNEEILTALWVGKTIKCTNMDILLTYESCLQKNNWFSFCFGSCCLSNEVKFYRRCKKERSRMSMRFHIMKRLPRRRE